MCDHPMASTDKWTKHSFLLTKDVQASLVPEDKAVQSIMYKKHSYLSCHSKHLLLAEK